MATLAFAPAEFSASLNSISFGSQDESTLYHRHVDSVDVVADTSVVVKTTTGDVLSYTGGSTITIQLAGGATTWTKQASCTRCSSLNVHLTSELDAAIDKAIDAFGTPNSRKLLGFSCW
jgi:endonuclease YncB( thermonuclease family)